jgi:hypothetical protein
MAWLASCLGLTAFGIAQAEEAKPVNLKTTADHSKFKELQREFKSGPELTKACLSLPHRGGRPDPPHQALEVGIQEPGHQAVAGQEERRQQLLHLDRLQRSRLQQLPRRLRVERRVV